MNKSLQPLSRFSETNDVKEVQSLRNKLIYTPISVIQRGRASLPSSFNIVQMNIKVEELITF